MVVAFHQKIVTPALLIAVGVRIDVVMEYAVQLKVVLHALQIVAAVLQVVVMEYVEHSKPVFPVQQIAEDVPMYAETGFVDQRKHVLPVRRTAEFVRDAVTEGALVVKPVLRALLTVEPVQTNVVMEHAEPRRHVIPAPEIAGNALEFVEMGFAILLKVV